jgi:hypothetical protein
MKWLYHSVGRGYWNVDRQLWRFMTPLISMGVSFVVGALVQANIVNGPTAVLSPPAAISLGFISGYFSDAAIAKMYEVANALFGATEK